MNFTREQKIKYLKGELNLTREQKISFLKGGNSPPQDTLTQSNFPGMNGPGLSDTLKFTNNQNTHEQIQKPPSFSPLSFNDTIRKSKRMGDSHAPASLSVNVKNPNPTPEQPNMLDKLTHATNPSLKDPDTKLTFGKMAMAPLEYMGAPARLLGAGAEKSGVSNLMRKTLGQKPVDTSNQNVLELMEDTDKGLLQPVRQAVHKGTEEWPAFARKATRLGTDIATGIGEDPTVLAGGAGFIKNIGKGASKNLPTLTKDITKKSIDDLNQGFQFTKAQELGEKFGPRARIEKYAQGNPFTDHIPGKIAEQNLEAIQNVVGRNAKRMGADDPINLSKSKRGDEIEVRFKDAKQDAQIKYGEGEDRLKNVVQAKIEDKIEGLKNSITDGSTPKSSFIPDKDIIKKTAVSKLDEHLASVNYTPGKTGNTGISSKALNKVLKLKNKIENEVETISDLIGQKRAFDDEVNVGSGQAWTGKSEAFLNKVYHKFNEAIEESITNVLGKEGKEVVDVWVSINKQYKEVIESHKSLSKKFNNFKTPQAVIDKISNIDPKELTKLRNSENESLRAIHEEISRGAFESLMAKSLTKESTISPDKIISQWNMIDKGVKNALFPKTLVDDMNQLVKNINKSNINNLIKLNPSMTSKANFLNRVMNNKIDAISAIVMGLGVRHYYKTGNLLRESVLDLIPNLNVKNIQSFRVATQETTGSR